MSTPVSGYFAHYATQHGTVYFYKGDDAAKAVMASMLRVEAAKAESSQQQALNAARALELPADQGSRIEPITVSIVSAIIAGAALAASATIAASSATSAATGIAAMVQQSNAGGLPTLEVEVENLTLSPLVLASYSSADASTSSVIKPLPSGESDTMVIVNSTAEFGKGDSTLTLNFWTGGGINEAGLPMIPIKAVCTAYYDESGNWCPHFSIDGSQSVNIDNQSSTFAAFFTSNSSQVLDFTIASIMTEKSTSSVYFMFLPGSSTYYG